MRSRPSSTMLSQRAPDANHAIRQPPKRAGRNRDKGWQRLGRKKPPIRPVMPRERGNPEKRRNPPEILNSRSAIRTSVRRYVLYATLAITANGHLHKMVSVYRYVV